MTPGNATWHRLPGSRADPSRGPILVVNVDCLCGMKQHQHLTVVSDLTCQLLSQLSTRKSLYRPYLSKLQQIHRSELTVMDGVHDRIESNHEYVQSYSPNLECFKGLDSIDIGRIELAVLDPNLKTATDVTVDYEKRSQEQKATHNPRRNYSSSFTDGQPSDTLESAYTNNITLILMTLALMMSVFIIALDANIIGESVRNVMSIRTIIIVVIDILTRYCASSNNDKISKHQ